MVFYERLKEQVKRKGFLNSIISLILIICVVLGYISVMQSTHNNDNVFYCVINNQLYRFNGSKNYHQISTNYISTTSLLDEDTIARSVSSLILESQTGNYVYYTENNDGSNKSFSLYVKNLRSFGNSVKVGTKINSVFLSEKGDRILYTKSTALYKFSPSEGTQRITGNYSSFSYDESQNYIAFVDVFGNLYVKKGNRENELIDEKVSALSGISSNGTLWYAKNGVLIERNVNGNMTTLSDNLVNDPFLTNNGVDKFYYITKYEEKTPVVKITGDSVPEDYQNMKDLYVITKKYSLNFYNGEKSVVVSDSLDTSSVFLSGSYVTFSEEYDSYENSPKPEDFADSFLYLEAFLSSKIKDYKTCIFDGESKSTLFYEKLSLISFSDSKNSCWYEKESEDEKQLYFVDISKNYQVTLLDNGNLNLTLLALPVGESLCYMRDYDKDTGLGSLVVDGKVLDENIKYYNVNCKNNLLYYIKSFTIDNGTLVCYDSSIGKTNTISDGVHSFTIARNGNVAFLGGYKNVLTRGTLYYGSKNPKKISLK